MMPRPWGNCQIYEVNVHRSHVLFSILPWVVRSGVIKRSFISVSTVSSARHCEQFQKTTCDQVLPGGVKNSLSMTFSFAWWRTVALVTDQAFLHARKSVTSELRYFVCYSSEVMILSSIHKVLRFNSWQHHQNSLGKTKRCWKTWWKTTAKQGYAASIRQFYVCLCKGIRAGQTVVFWSAGILGPRILSMASNISKRVREPFCTMPLFS